MEGDDGYESDGLERADYAAGLGCSRESMIIWTVEGPEAEVVYTIGATTRTAAALFATKNGLLGEEEPVLA